MVATFILILLLVVCFILVWIQWNSCQRVLESWRRAGVPCPKAWPILGNYASFVFQTKACGVVADEICQKYSDAPCIGTLYGTEPALLIQDPELIRTVLNKDFVYFNGRNVSKYTDRETITMSLAFTYGNRWKVIRQNMTPLFTSYKIKEHVRKCNAMFEDLLEYLTKSGKNSNIDVKDITTRYTMDNICSIGFGVDTDALITDYDQKNPYTRIGRMIFDKNSIKGIAIMVRSIWPAIFYGLGLKIFPDTISKFFNNLLIKVFEDRNYQPSLRNDFVDMVLGLKKLGTIECESMMKDGIVRIELDREFIIAQCIVFFAAGYETSSTTLSFTLYELAKDQSVQEKVHKEIDSYLKINKNKLDYSCINNLPYLEACLNETLRLYPLQPLLTRETMVDRELGGLKVPKGTRIHIPVLHMHYQEKYYPEPLKFKPERWLGDNRQSIKQYTYMPFGEGNRICVGIRVAKMMIIPGLVTILKRYRLELAPGMPRTLTVDPRAFVSQAKEDLKIRFIPRLCMDQVKYDRSP